MAALSWRRFAVIAVALFLIAVCSESRFHGNTEIGSGFRNRSFSARKLLGQVGGVSTDRIGAGGGGGCSIDDITVYTGQTAPLPSGIPTYTVEVLNLCVSGCSMREIHLRCGWFSSARLVNPRVFRRVGFNDCLVNDGRPLRAGDTLSFEYANTYSYPLSVSSASCH